MQDVQIKKGYGFRMSGGPSLELLTLADPSRIAFLPAKIPSVKPRLKVAEGDSVSIGSLLFEDKHNADLRFLSPAAGVVSQIAFGPRRVIEAIVIDRDPDNEERIQFPAISTSQLEAMDRSRLVKHIQAGGLWWIFRRLPFRDIADTQSAPPVILVGLSDQEPFKPAPGVYLQGGRELMVFGLKILEKLAMDRVIVFAGGHTPIPGEVKDLLTHEVRGNYPSDDPGTLLYHIKKTAEENRAWYVTGQDLILLARLLSLGEYPVERIYCVAGSGAPEPRHIRSRLGVPLSHLVDPNGLEGDIRFVVGGLFTGYTSDGRGFMGHCETALNLVPQGGDAEFLALFKPGMDKPTYSRTFLSRFNSGRLVYDCNLHGGQRACIACMHCADVCPVDIMPHMVYKAILADEVEEYLAHGLLDCVECGLCSYVCPSKIELRHTFINAKAAYAKEQAG